MRQKLSLLIAGILLSATAWSPHVAHVAAIDSREAQLSATQSADFYAGGLGQNAGPNRSLLSTAYNSGDVFAGAPVTITVGSASETCTYNVAPATQSFNASGSQGSVSVTAQAGCAWAANSSSSWITISAGSSGDGNGTVSYTVAANTSARSRVGGLLVAGRYITIVQSGSPGNCPVTPLTIPQTVNGTLSTNDCRSVVDDNSYADLYSFSAQTGQRVAISLASATFDAYLTLIAPNGSTIASNDDDVSSDSRIPRGSDYFIVPLTGTYIIDASSFSANEVGNYMLSLTTTTSGGNCTYTLTPTSGSFNAAGGSGTINVGAPAGCTWTAHETTSWLSIDTGASGSGPGTVNYTVAGNTSQGYRLSKLLIAGQFIPIAQSGTGGDCPITPLTIPQTVNGSWSVGDCANGSGEFTDLYSFNAPGGQQVSIALTTTNNFTSLTLWGPTASTVSGYTGNGSLRIPPGTGYIVLPFSGTYIIEAASGTQGSYTLSLNAPPVTQPNCPTISGVNPSSGAVGSTVTITGTNFTGVTAVKFANNVTAQFTINNDTSIAATVPIGAVSGPLTLSRANCADTQTSIFTVAGGGGNCVTAPNGAIAWLPGDGNANDVAGSNHGTRQNGASFASGLVGQAFSLDGVNDVVQVPDSPSLDFSPNAPLTVEFWVYRTALNSIMHFVGKRVNCEVSAINYQLALNTTTSEGLSFGGAAGRVNTGVNLPLNTWTHLAGTFDGTTFRLYLNGQLAGSAAGTLGPANAAPLIIGGSGSCQTFAGLLDEVSIYNRALSASEIQTIFNANSGGKCKPTPGGCTVKADYLFQNTLASSVGSPPELTNLGTNTFGTAMVDGSSRTVLQFPKDNGLALAPTTGVISNSVYSIVKLFAFNDVSGWRRVFEFKNGTGDAGLYVYNGKLNFYNGLGEGMTQIAANSFVQVVLTRDANKLVTVYANGVLQFSFTDSSDLAVIDANNRLRFFQDNTSGGLLGETSAGAVARIRVYDCALTPSEVAGLDRLPGQTPVCTLITGLNTNRLCNPNAELGQGATDKSQVVPIPGWTSSSPFTALRYDAPGSLTVAESQLIGGGTNFFYGGDTNPSSTATQLVNVADEATGIDAGQRTAQLQAYLGGYGGDNAAIRAEFLSAGGTVLGTPLLLGPRSDDLQLLSTSGQVPASTRAIRITMTSTRLAGNDNEGYFDNLSLNLTQSGGVACPTVSGINPASGVVGSTVTITGSNFTGATAVRFSSNVSASFAVNSNTQMTATVPSGAVTGPIAISKTGCSDVQTATFTMTAGQCIAVAISTGLTGSSGSSLTVPITASDATGRGAISYDLTLTYDPTVLRLQTTPYDRTGTLSAAMTVTTNTSVAGQLILSGFGTNALTGAGTLLNLKFDVIGGASACSNLTWVSFRFNEGTPCATTTNGRACAVGGSIAGAVSYCITPKAVPSVTVSAAGTPSAMTTTNSGGAYQLTGLGVGAYTVTPTKTGDVNGIASFDAALIAQHVVALATLNSCQQLAGDSSGDGGITSFDAALVAQFAVGIANQASKVGTWKFVPPSRSYATLSGDQSNQNYDAVLVGDVSGNWATGAVLAEAQSQPDELLAQQAAQVALPELVTGAGTSLILPITVGDLTGRGVLAYDFDLIYDAGLLQAQGQPVDATDTLSSNFTVTPNATPGRLRVSGFGTMPLTGSGVLLKVRFNVIGSVGNNTVLTWQAFQFNEGSPTATAVPGRVTVVNVYTLSLTPSTQTIASAAAPH